MFHVEHRHRWIKKRMFLELAFLVWRKGKIKFRQRRSAESGWWKAATQSAFPSEGPEAKILQFGVGPIRLAERACHLERGACVRSEVRSQSARPREESPMRQ